MGIAILGLGNIAKTHVQALRALGQKVVLAVGSNEKKAQTFASEWKIANSSANWETILGEDIDTVHICLPPGLHEKAIRMALEAGKGVVCEKPLCLDPQEAWNLYLLAKEKGVTGAVNFNVRYQEGLQAMRQSVQSGTLGRLCLVHGSYLQEFHVLPTAYSWRYRPDVAGPMRAVTEIGSHFIDTVRFLTGAEIVRVSAVFGKFTPERILKDEIMYERTDENKGEELWVDSEDAAAVTFRLDNGALGNVVLSEVSCGRGNSLRISLDGNQGALWWNSQESGVFCQAGKQTGVLRRENDFGNGFLGSFLSLFRQVYEQKADYPTFYDGYVNALVCNAIYESAQKNGAWVDVRRNPPLE